MFGLNFEALSVGAVCDASANVIDTIISQVFQLFGFEAVQFAAFFCDLIALEFVNPLLS